MKHFSVLSAALLSVTSAQVMADEAQVNDPADVTRPQTYLKVDSGAKGKDGMTRLQLNMAGSYSEDIGYLGQFETDFQTNLDAQPGKSKDFGLSRIRARYFQVHATGLEVLPEIGFSLDYISYGSNWVAKNSGTEQTAAIGAVAKVITPFENWVSYPNLAVMKNEYDNGRSENGWQANWFNSFYLTEKGSYITVNPQYANYNNAIGKNEQSLELNFEGGIPLTNDGSIWGNVTYSEHFFKAAGESRMKHLDGNREVRIGATWFF
ncbi:hypothetical protein L1D26_14825 [Vibrio mediterranei]|uniref:hypothetical protein n=1 Tax=Vibrio TaxID=662 RepID=UPI0004E1424F|nr:MULTISPECIES: hypothetical protein [Vibrio]MCG9664354.1 hypothetical protein [Vibrio mediterranei]MCY9851612.1 hypothetical protein [Vibrio mediterranei]NUW71366.1 hypothetical protein [Vibrio mediterranei]USE01107.1 hypothetical protein JKJ11_03260 [Vibrio sp. SCSIO 43133]